jgi:PAS domain S-box-containing protein
METTPRQPDPQSPPRRFDAVVWGAAALDRLRRGEPCDVLLVAERPEAERTAEVLQACLGESGRPVVLAPVVPAPVVLPSGPGGAGQLAHEAALAALSEGVLVADADRRVTFANAALLRLTGYAASELLGGPLSFLWGEQSDLATVRHVERALAEARPYSAVVVAYRRDGATFWCQFTLAPVLDAAGSLVHVVAVVRDVTTSHLLEEQVRHAQKLEAIDQLSGGVAHDFNNLLTIITGNIELLEDSAPDTPDITDPLQEISRAAKRAAELTRQLLTFGRKQVRDMRVLDLGVVVDQMVTMLRRIVGDGIRIEVDHRVRPALVRADQGMMEQVVMNLCVNARDAMPGGGRLQISVEPASPADVTAGGRTLGTAPAALASERLLRLSVADTGGGIPIDTRERIFEPFFTTKGEGKGTGLGLATVCSIARLHGGACALESEVGRGTRVFVWLPAVESEAAVDEQRAPSGGTSAGS